MRAILIRWTLRNLLSNRPNYYGSGIATSAIRATVWEPDKKSGYGPEKTRTLDDRMRLIRNGFGELKDEIKLWKNEMYEKIIDDPAVFIEPGTVDFIWKFDNEKMLGKWTTTTDRDHNEGFSQCSLHLNENGHALFSGTLQLQPPKDGRVKRAGYCNMRSMRPRRSFKRAIYHDWDIYTHLLLRIRGDGRPYMLSLSTSGSVDILWNDIYQYVLYTRGGPYWQTAKIPFSRFFLTSKGRVQDKQRPIPLNRITNIGITCGDRMSGPFQLEIDFIAVQYDPTHTEEFAYEMYQLPNFIAGV